MGSPGARAPSHGDLAPGRPSGRTRGSGREHANSCLTAHLALPTRLSPGLQAVRVPRRAVAPHGSRKLRAFQAVCAAARGEAKQRSHSAQDLGAAPSGTSASPGRGAPQGGAHGTVRATGAWIWPMEASAAARASVLPAVWYAQGFAALPPQAISSPAAREQPSASLLAPAVFEPSGRRNGKRGPAFLAGLCGGKGHLASSPGRDGGKGGEPVAGQPRRGVEHDLAIQWEGAAGRLRPTSLRAQRRGIPREVGGGGPLWMLSQDV